MAGKDDNNGSGDSNATNNEVDPSSGEEQSNDVNIIQEYDFLDSKLDELNSALDLLEQKNDDIHERLKELLESNREIRQEMKKDDSNMETN